MTDTKYNCDVCEDTGKTTKWIIIDGNWVDDGEEDCECVIEKIEEARGQSQLESHLEENGSEPMN